MPKCIVDAARRRQRTPQPIDARLTCGTGPELCVRPYNPALDSRPVHLEMQKDRGLTIHWAGGTKSFYPVAYLRRMSPSAEVRALREEMASNPLAVIPAAKAHADGPLTALGAELVGNYAIRISFSDGHQTGIYSWEYLQEIDPEQDDTG